MTAGQKIKAVRKEYGMTQAELASRIGVTNDCISMWERGERNPKYGTLVRLAEAIGVNVNRFLPVNEWISVKERLPEEGILVLAYINGLYGHYVDVVRWDGFFSMCRHVTHWMPLPEPPNCGADMRGEKHG